MSDTTITPEHLPGGGPFVHRRMAAKKQRNNAKKVAEKDDPESRSMARRFLKTPVAESR
jgi:hypothetical protein